MNSKENKLLKPGSRDGKHINYKRNNKLMRLLICTTVLEQNGIVTL